MIETFYIEKELLENKHVKQLTNRFAKAHQIVCENYREVFNRKGQNFRLQKHKPSFILAKKYGELLHPIPPSFSIGAKHNYYFSHFLNCPYDCNYCYLQAMLPSAHYVFFVNFDQFQEAIQKKVDEVGLDTITFYSGYDGDSLAMEPITHFCEEFLPFFATLPPTAELEIRTKSVLTTPFMKTEPVPNVIIAYTLNPDPIARKFETNAPLVKARIDALCRVAERGWKIGLRFDPILDVVGSENLYTDFFTDLFRKIPHESIHSITLGTFRLPKAMQKTMAQLQRKDGLVISEQRPEILFFCKHLLEKNFPKEKVFVCQEPSSSQAPALALV